MNHAFAEIRAPSESLCTPGEQYDSSERGESRTETEAGVTVLIGRR
jgi:hypothetical protein